MIETYICAFLHEKIGGGGAYMDVDWKWRKSENNLKKEGIYYELWKFWWTICATRAKRKVK